MKNRKKSHWKHRLCLKLFGGRELWHQRKFSPDIQVIEGQNDLWFQYDGKIIKTLPLAALQGKFKGRCNLLLSGPSVKKIKDPHALTRCDWIGVNGSPKLLGDNLSNLRIYHVNDSQYVRSSLESFLNYAAAAEYTIIDYRGMYSLLHLAIDRLPDTKWVVYDSWAYPLRLPLGKIQEIVSPPEHRGIYLSPDLRLGLPTAGTVAYSAAQIAWHGGYDSLYIYGLDLSNSGRFYSEDKANPQMLDDAFERAILPGFELLARETSKTGFQIFNCNPDSKLPATVLPHLDTETSLQTN